MPNKISAKGTIAIFFLFLFCASSQAMTLLTQREALRNVFGEEATIVSEKRTLTDKEFEAVKARLGGKMDTYQKGRNNGDVGAVKEFPFYFGVKDGERFGVATILEASGKWGPIQFIVVLDMAGKVKDVAVMRYTETRGRPIARRSFLRQFFGKTSRDAFELNNDIVAVSGATISSTAAAFIVKKAIVLYEELYLKTQEKK